MNRKNIATIIPLSPAQEGMLYETIQASEPGMHIEQSMYSLTGRLDVVIFERAWQWVVDRHTILRTGFVWKEQEEPLQVTFRQVSVALTSHDWRGLSWQEQQARTDDLFQGERRRGFDLLRPPLMRLLLVRLDEESYRFLWTCHHILMDGWSQQILLNEVITCYRALKSGGPVLGEPSRPYSDYIAWLKRQEGVQAEQFWRKMLSGVRQPTALGRDPESGVVHDVQERYGSARMQLSEQESRALGQVAQHHHVTLSTLVQGVWALLLRRYSGSQNVVFGVTVSGRPAELAGVETMVGPFFNTLPLRIRVPAQIRLWPWLEELQRHTVEMYAYEYISAGQIHQWSEMAGRSLLYESLLVVENYPVSATEAGLEEMKIEAVGVQGAQTKYALTFLVVVGSRVQIQCVYDTSRFEQSAVNQIMTHFHSLLGVVATDPEEQLETLYGGLPENEIPIVYPTRDLVQVEPGRNDQPPRTPMEDMIAGVWAEVLGLAQVSRESHFFTLGGHSLLATQLLTRVRTIVGVEVPLRTIFEEPTMGGFARRVEELLRQGDGVQMPPLVASTRPEALPLSYAQQRLWFMEQLEPGSPTYLAPHVLTMNGQVESASLEQALQEVVSRHESLRTTFAEQDGQPVQVIHRAKVYRVPVIDLQGVSREQRAVEAQRLARQEAQHPCDLVQGPLLRTALLRLAPQEHVLFLTLHHIITDGWSTGVLVRELTTLYRSFEAGQPSPLAPLPIQYADYALWERQWLQGEVLESQLTYWKKQLAGIASLHLPADQHQPLRKSHRGAAYSFTLNHDLSEALVSLSSQEQVTLFMILLAIFQVLLHYFSGQDDIVVGTDVANRQHVEIEGLIGFFVNQLVLRTDLSKNPTFRALLRQVRRTALEAYTHQGLPFEKLVGILRPKRSAQSSPLFQVKFLLNKTFDLMLKEKDELLVSGVTMSQERLSLVMNKEEDLLLNMYEGSQGIMGTFIYNADLFEATTIAHMARRFMKLTERICAHPDSRLGMLKLLIEKEEEEEEMEQKKSMNDAFSQFELVQPRPVRLQQEPLTQTSYLSVEERLPLVISPQKIALDIVEWAKSNQAFIEAELRKHGALLFRGFHALSPVDFEQFALALCPDLFQENGEHVPANVGAGNLYTPVFYPQEKKLLWHNENSFNTIWPMKILFFCAQPAEKGGETPIADNRKVFQRIDPSIREQFMQKGIMYIRNYGEGLGLPWQEVFRTEKREDVESYCRKADIAFEWKDQHHLKTRLVRPAVLKHPQTGEWLWWNQATHWHPACLEDEVRASLLALFSEEDLPRNCFYGDGSPIEDGVMDAICQAYQEAEVSFPWRQGDILLLDNMLTAHARNPYEGQRKIYVSMGNMVTLNDLSQAR